MTACKMQRGKVFVMTTAIKITKDCVKITLTLQNMKPAFWNCPNKWHFIFAKRMHANKITFRHSIWAIKCVWPNNNIWWHPIGHSNSFFRCSECFERIKWTYENDSWRQKTLFILCNNSFQVQLIHPTLVRYKFYILIETKRMPFLNGKHKDFHLQVKNSMVF